MPRTFPCPQQKNQPCLYIRCDQGGQIHRNLLFQIIISQFPRLYLLQVSKAYQIKYQPQLTNSQPFGQMFNIIYLLAIYRHVLGGNFTVRYFQTILFLSAVTAASCIGGFIQCKVRIPCWLIGARSWHLPWDLTFFAFVFHSTSELSTDIFVWHLHDTSKLFL